MGLAERIAFVDDEFAARQDARGVSACFACWFVRGLFAAGLIFWLILVPVALWHFLPDMQSVLDFVAPTAAQARDMGWVALSEGR